MAAFFVAEFMARILCIHIELKYGYILDVLYYLRG